MVTTAWAGKKRGGRAGIPELGSLWREGRKMEKEEVNIEQVSHEHMAMRAHLLE